MDVELHLPDGTQVAGYRPCICGTLVLDHTWFMMGGMCQDCWSKGRARRVHLQEIIYAGRRTNLPKIGHKQRNRGKNTNHGTRKAAKEAALRRLADLEPAMFSMLYAEERLKRGLPPVALRSYEVTPLKGVETYEFDAVYAALSEAGEPDGPT